MSPSIVKQNALTRTWKDMERQTSSASSKLKKISKSFLLIVLARQTNRNTIRFEPSKQIVGLVCPWFAKVSHWTTCKQDAHKLHFRMYKTVRNLPVQDHGLGSNQGSFAGFWGLGFRVRVWRTRIFSPTETIPNYPLARQHGDAWLVFGREELLFFGSEIPRPTTFLDVQ